MRPRTEGFSLIEAVVVIAIMAILAGAAAPLAMKALDQQRTVTTRANLQIAWQSMFGSQASQVMNMRSDFNFSPPAATTLTDLREMVSQVALVGPPPVPYGTHAPATFLYGWRGPYWGGSVGTVGGQSVPVDGWGNPIQLTYTGGLGWQVTSSGPSGAGVYLAYPSNPIDVNVANNSYTATVFISINSNRQSPTISGSMTCQDVSNPAGVTFNNITVAAGGSYLPPTLPINGYIAVCPGPVSITINFPLVPANLPIPSYSAVSFTQSFDLLPGQTQVINLPLN